MWYGPINPTLPYSGTGHNPVKSLKVVMNGQGVSKPYQVQLFSKTHPLALQHDVYTTETTTVLYTANQTSFLALMHQMEEISFNAEWQRCGFYIQWRDDGTPDGEDGWYIVNEFDVKEDFVFSGYAEPKISVNLRQKTLPYLGMFVDAKAKPNFLNLSGTTLAAYPAGLDMTNLNPSATWQYSASDGSTIFVVENPAATLQAPLQTPLHTMTLSRCALYDASLDDTTSTEVFWTDHRYINPYLKVSNGLVRYSVNIASANTVPIIEVWNGSAWTLLGHVQFDGGAAGIQRTRVLTVSPEEIIWEEQRWAPGVANDNGRYVVTNRIRRGSRIVECQVVCAANGNATQPDGALYLSNVPLAITGASVTPDGSATVGTGGTSVVPGWLYLDEPVATSSLISTFDSGTALLGGGNALLGQIILGDGGQLGGTSYTNFDSGYALVEGTVTRFGILAGYQDAQYTAAGSATAYATSFSSYNRTRVRQRILVSS